MIKYLFCFFAMASLCWFSSYVFFQRDPASQNDAARAEQLRGVIDCALDKVANPTIKERASATLDFIDNQLVRKFDSYEITSNIEKAHFFAQVMQESAYFTKTVESAGGPTWEDSLVFDSRSSIWNCSNYLSAIGSDRDYFNGEGRYEHLKDTYDYKAPFRGRGLIQLTHCYSYLYFFYHMIAENEGRSDLADKAPENIVIEYLDEEEEFRTLGRREFCTNEELESMTASFERDGLYLPRELAVDFENTVDRLSLPCNVTTVSFMQSPEFIVGSSFWFWRQCKRRYPNAPENPSDTAVGELSECVHGPELYLDFNSEWCQDGTPVKNYLDPFVARGRTLGVQNRRERILTSYCSRLHNFNALTSCFE